MKKGKIILTLAIACLTLCGCGNGQSTSSYGDEENPYTTPSLEKAEEILTQEISDGTTYLIRDLKGDAYVDVTFTKDDADGNTEKLVQSILIRTQVLKEYDNVTFCWYDPDGIIGISMLERGEDGNDTSPTYGIYWYRQDYYNKYMEIMYSQATATETQTQDTTK